MTNNVNYDVIIIGGGPAGLTAGLYTSRARLKSLLVEKEIYGGLITETWLVENYPGFPEGISGEELGQLMYQQAKKYDMETLKATVTGIELQEKHKIVKTTKGDFTARAVIIANGSERIKLGVPGEEEFTGKGVAYCATCDAAYYQDVPVAIAGGGDVGLTEAMFLTKFASSVTVIELMPKLGASRILQERAAAEPKIKFLLNTRIEAIEGDAFVNKIRLRQVVTGEESSLEVEGIFVSIGIRPETSYLKGVVPLDAAGQVITNEKMETGVPGIFAAGDIRNYSARQAVTAAGDGATTAIYVDKYLSD